MPNLLDHSPASTVVGPADTANSKHQATFTPRTRPTKPSLITGGSAIPLSGGDRQLLKGSRDLLAPTAPARSVVLEASRNCVNFARKFCTSCLHSDYTEVNRQAQLYTAASITKARKRSRSSRAGIIRIVLKSKIASTWRDSSCRASLELERDSLQLTLSSAHPGRAALMPRVTLISPLWPIPRLYKNDTDVISTSAEDPA